MAYKVIILYQLYMPSYFLGTFTEYPFFGLAFEATKIENFDIDEAKPFIRYVETQDVTAVFIGNS